MGNIKLTNWGPLLYFFPNHYISRDSVFEKLDINKWTEEYEYESDDWWIFGDFAAEPLEMLERPKGDCEDYALVAASWGVQNGRNMRLAWLWGSPEPWPTHVVAYDDNRVYSSGKIKEMSMEEYLESSDYHSYVSRKLRT